MVGSGYVLQLRRRPGVTTQVQATTTTKKGTDMQTQELHEPTGPQSLLDRSVDSDGAGPVFERITRFTRTLNILRKGVPAALLAVLVTGAFSAVVPAVPAYASPTTLKLTAYAQNSTGVPMVAEAVTNHVLKRTSDAINMFVNGKLVVECKSRDCTTELGLAPGQTALVTADVGPRGTVPYTANAIVSAETTVVVVHHIITCHGTTCM
jgi:hypothetical protein